MTQRTIELLQVCIAEQEGNIERLTQAIEATTARLDMLRGNLCTAVEARDEFAQDLAEALAAQPERA